MDKYRILQNSLVASFVIVLVLLVWLGINSGQARAQSKLIVLNAEAIAQGMGYFESDYDRFPTEREYQTLELMDSYFEPWPDTQFATEVCPQSLSYENVRYNEYSIKVCLPAAYQNLPEGLSEFTVSQ